MQKASTSELVIIWTVAILFFMESLDSSVLNTSLPQIAYSLGVNPIALKIALTSYLLSLGVFIPISGWIADRFGVQRILILAVGVFAIGSIGCGLSDNLPTLVLCRILQGVGGSFTTPIGRLVMLRTFQKERLLYAMMRVTALGLIGPALGPVLGGALTTYWSWRWIFFINIPVAISAIFMIRAYFPKTGRPIDRPFDGPGFVLFGCGLGLLLYVLDIAAEPTPDLSIKILLGVLVLFFLGLYALRSRRTQYPMLDMNIFREPIFRRMFFASTLCRLSISSFPFLIPLLLQLAFGYTPLQAGAVLIFLVSGNILNKFILQGMINRFGYRWVLPGNTFLLLVSYSTLSLIIIPHFNIIAFCTWGFLSGFVTATQYASMTSLMFYYIPDADRSMANSFFSTSTQVASCFGIAFSALGLELLIGQTNLTHHIDPHYFSEVMLGVAGLLIFGFLAILKTTRSLPKTALV